MLSSNNILKPSDGRPVTLPSQDMIIGLYHLTTKRVGSAGEGRVFGSVSEAIMAFDAHELHLNSQVKIRLEGFVPYAGWEAPEGWEQGQPALVDTSLGQVLFNETLPEDYPWVEAVADKGELSRIVNDLAERYPKVVTAATLDNLKDAGFYWATRSGVTVAISDIEVPDAKPAILAGYEERAAKIQGQYDKGLIDDDERRQELIEIWNKATNEIAQVMRDSLSPMNTINRMVSSGARGNWMQVRQIAGIRGLVANPKGEIIPRPIKSSYREGLSVLEYFIATHGARKGLADTALRTANSGYLTRRLVDVSQDVIVREEDCGTERGLVTPIAVADANGELTLDENVENSAYARTLAVDVVDSKGNVLAPAGTDCGDVVIAELFAAGITEVKVRSVLTCESSVGTCALCYGRSLATGKTVDIGEAVGIIAAQSIGEPGTQLTMRTFHTGGAVSASGGDDITQGLPRIQELFEARTPKGVAPIAEAAGRITIEESERQMRLVITPDDGSEEIAYPVLRRSRLLIEDGQHVSVGQKLINGPVDPKQVLRIMGPRAAQKFLVDEVQGVYRSQGIGIHDKHVEVIVRQMLRRVTVIESGDSDLLPGELAERARFEDANRRVVSEGKTPASGRPELMGITKASLATESWLSAASFQETTRVLTQAAMEGKSDPLLGLKENVIIGKLIPAGTGLPRYTEITVEPTEEAKANLFTGPSAFSDFSYDTLGGDGAPEFHAIPLDDYDLGNDFR
jgi:DNA-directed RNA polymerase subunit beta'